MRRYQRERPGELLHFAIKKLARFDGVGHRITGDRRGASKGMGYDCLHVAIDDATRIAYVEVLPDEKKQSTTISGCAPALVQGARRRGRAGHDQQRRALKPLNQTGWLHH